MGISVLRCARQYANLCKNFRKRKTKSRLAYKTTMYKKINELNSLSDMLKLPISVHLGATLNLLFTLWLTHIVFLSTNGSNTYLLIFAILIVFFNILPVIVLRSKDKEEREYPLVNKMDFLKDQHRFSTWVYGIACGNMFFWITFSWCVFSCCPTKVTLIAVQAFVFVVTFAPLWRKFFFEKFAE